MEIKQTKKTNFLIQGSILAIAGILVRLIGLAYRIPMTRIIGEEGMGYYSAAYNVYSVILLLSSYSLPLAVSKMISARVGNRDFVNAGRILKASLLYATIVGAIACFLVYFYADWFSDVLFQMPLSKYALKALAPTLWIMAYLGVFRGYYQGHATMIPTAFSQIFEQICNALVSIFAAYYLCEMAIRDGLGFSQVKAYGAAGGTIGTGAGAAIALLVLLLLFIFEIGKRKEEKKADIQKPREDYKSITRILFFTIVPVIASTAIYNINSIIDSAIFGNAMAMLGQMKETPREYGIYTSKYLILINVPVAISNALSSSLIPVLSKSAAVKDDAGIHKNIAMAMRFASIISLPCAIGLLVLANPIISLLFGESQKAIFLMQIGSMAVVFYSISTISNAILQGTNHMSIPVRNSFISLILHIFVLMILLYVFRLGSIGLVFANMFFALSMCILNAMAIRAKLFYRQEITKTFVLPFLCSLIMGGVTFGIYYLLHRFVRWQHIGPVQGHLIECILPLVCAILIYPFLLIFTKAINEEELLLMPKGRKMVNVLKRWHIL